MGRKLLLALALAVLGAVVVASTGNADSDGLETSTSGHALVDQNGAIVPACSNGRDDDGDGRIDGADPGCSGPLDTSEYNPPPPACSNGRDDDGDGRIDLADPGCSGPLDTSEYNPPPPACSNGRDDDGDGRIDGADPGCSGPGDSSEYNRPGGGGGGGGDDDDGGGGDGGGGGTGKGRLPKEFFGIAWGSPTGAQDLRKQKKANVRTERITVPWSRVQPAKGAYAWGPVDAKVGALAIHGIRPLIAIFGAPRWATGFSNPAVPPLKGKAKKAWTRFVKKAVRRYKKRGVFWREHPNLPKKPVTAWQIWNEPNLPKYFRRKGSTSPKLVKNAPKQYAKLVKAASKGINKADRKAKVILAGLSGNPKKTKDLPHKFLKKFLKARKIKKHFNAAALHPYAPSIKDYKKRLKKFRKALVKKGAKKKGIWLTEVGWGSGKPDNKINKGTGGQARILKKSFELTVKKRKKWNIDRLYWFDWRDYHVRGRPLCGFCPYAGLVNIDGTRKPALKQFKKFARKQRGRR